MMNWKIYIFTYHYGNFTGNSLLAGCGPNVKVKVIPIGTVTTDFKTEFVSAGINQTRHRVYLTVYCTMYVAAPLVGNEIIVNNGVVVAETVLIGDVPEFYGGTDSGMTISR